MKTSFASAHTDRSQTESSARQKLTALRFEFDCIDSEGQADGPRGRELRAQIGLLAELIGRRLVKPRTRHKRQSRKRVASGYPSGHVQCAPGGYHEGNR